MRTTVTLEPDVATRLKRHAHETGSSFKAAINAVLRRGLTAQEPPASPRPPFAVRPHRGGFQPGIDHGKLNQLLDQLDVEDFAGESRDR